MTIKELAEWQEGRDMYFAFQQFKDVDLRLYPRRCDFIRLARQLDLPIAHVERRISFYLEH